MMIYRQARAPRQSSQDGETSWIVSAILGCLLFSAGCVMETDSGSMVAEEPIATMTRAVQMGNCLDGDKLDAFFADPNCVDVAGKKVYESCNGHLSADRYHVMGYIDECASSVLGFQGSWWKGQALTTNEQELLTACLLALVNSADESTVLSMAWPSGPRSVAEQSDYTMLTSAYWGNKFDVEAAEHACYAPDPALVCGRTPVGMASCDSQCQGYTPTRGYTSCTAPGLTTSNVITVFINEADHDCGDACGSSGGTGPLPNL